MNSPIAMIPYANMAPYLEMGPPEACYFVQCKPRDSIQALQSGAVWAAAVPVGGLAALGDQVVPLGLFGIGALRKVMSVLFFSRLPFDQFGPRHTVRLTDESASSVRLLYLLMGRRLGFDRLPALAAPGAPADGELLIGDRALKWHFAWEAHGTVKGFDIATDLADQWYHYCQLPFVFARWVVRSDAPQEIRGHLLSWLDAFAGREPALIERSVPKVAQRLDLPEDYVRRYLHTIRRVLTDTDQAGQDRFRQEWQRYEAGGNRNWFAAS